MRKLSVVICTHNPKSQYFHRVLDGLREQNLPLQEWELLIVDNASKERISEKWDLSWHPNGRVIYEEELGLTPARLSGISQSEGNLIVFVDDDNLLHEDYLSEALNVEREWPQIGAWNGSVSAEFSCPPPGWLRPYLPGLAIDEIDTNFWTNIPYWSKATPFGAGMCVRRCVAEFYAEQLAANPVRRHLDRVGDGLFSGGDTDLAWCAIDMGMGTGRFHKLKLTHLIPASRMQEDYIVQLYSGFPVQDKILRMVRGERINPQRSIFEIPRYLWRWTRSSKIQRRILSASRRMSKNVPDNLADSCNLEGA